MKQSNEDEEARIKLWIHLDRFDIEIKKSQFDCLIRILNHISNYQKFQFNFYETRKFKPFKPNFKIFDNNRAHILQSEVKNENARLWFKWAIEMVVKKLKYSRGESKIFDLPVKRLEKYKESFESLFKKFLKEKENNNNLSLNSIFTTEELFSFVETIEYVELQTLFLWVKPVIQEIYRETKKEENKKAKTGFFSKMFGKGLKEEDLISKEEEEKIEEILENSLKDATNKVINSDTETKIKIDFLLEEGSFKFSKSFAKQNTEWTEGFGFKYKQLDFSLKKGEYFTELDSGLKYFNVEMFTLINKNQHTIPITFSPEFLEKEKSILQTTQTNQRSSIISQDSMVLTENNQDSYVWKVNFRKNAPNSEINSKLNLKVNSLNLLYHQVLLERMIGFLQVNLTEDLATQAWDKLEQIKQNTQESLKDAIGKKNIIEMHIEPRKVFVPINKYDLKNSRMLVVEIGKTTMYNAIGDDLYSERYNLEISTLSLSYFNSFLEAKLNACGFDLISDISAKLGFAVLSPGYSNLKDKYPAFKIFVDVDNVKITTTEYLYTLLMYVIDLFKPAREVDMWSQINSDKDEIKKSCKVFAKCLKRNRLYRNWEDYYAVLSGGYIYFYLSASDEEYTGYYYIKDAQLKTSVEDPLMMILENNYGIIEIIFQSESKYKQWTKALNERIGEMKSSYEIKTEEYSKSDLVSSKNSENSIYLGLELNIKNVTLILKSEGKSGLDNSRLSLLSNFNNSSPSFTIDLKNLNLILNLTDLEVFIGLSLNSLCIFDDLAIRKEFHCIFDSHDPENESLKLVNLQILVLDEKSPKYKNSQIEIGIDVGYLYAIWHPQVIRRLLSYLAHNDILRHKVLKEIQSPVEKILSENFFEPVKEANNQQISCNDAKYTYLSLTTNLKRVRVVWIQPVLNFMYTEMRLNNALLNVDMKVDHFTFTGELGNTQIFDLSNYPFTIRNQDQFDTSKIKEILGAKENSSSLISFSYKSMNTWCKECQNNYTSEAIVNINSVNLLYIQEHFLRFFNYLFAEFLGSLGPSEEVKIFRESKIQKVEKDPNQIEFMLLKVVLNNPQAILKPRAHFTENFLVDFGKVTITQLYTNLPGKNRTKPDEKRWVATYHFMLENFLIRTQDNFLLCDPTDGYVNMHFPYLSEDDKKMSDLDFDKSFQIDLFFQSLNLNLRQVDFMNLMRCNDLNILYTDEQYDDYDYEKFYKSPEDKIPLQNKNNLPNNIPDESSQKLLDSFYSLFFVLFVPRISIKLFLDQKPFSELTLHDKQLNFFKKLNDKKEVNICVSSMEIFHFITESKKEIIVSDFIQSMFEFDSVGYNKMINNSKMTRRATAIINVNLNEKDKDLSPLALTIHDEFEEGSIQPERVIKTRNKQLDLKIIIDAEREKSYMITLNGLKLLIGNTTINLIKQFFMEGFPYYDTKDTDLPNLYDPNEENNPGMKVFLEIKNPLICFLTEDISNQDQDMICLSTEIVIGLKREKLAKIKSELFYNYTELTNLKLFVNDEAQKESLEKALLNDKSDVYSLTVSLMEVCPFITSMKDVLFSELLVIPKRKITDNFFFVYDSKYQMQYIPPNNYVISYDCKMEINKVNIKASYRDIVIFLKSIGHLNNQMTESYQTKMDSLLYYSKRKAECDLNSKKEVTSNNQEISKKIDKSLPTQNTNDSSNFEEKNPFSISKDFTGQLKTNNINEEDEACDLQEFDELFEKGLSESLVRAAPKESSFQKFKPKDIIIDKGMGKFTLSSQGVQLILIDDHSNTFYPFLSVVLNEAQICTEYLNQNQSIMNAGIVFKVLVYNYIAGVWEPLVEKTGLNVEVTTDTADEKVHSTSINLHFPIPENKPYMGFNINISDMMISFLYSTMNSWIDKYFKLTNNYTEEVKKLNVNKGMNITNHKIFNFTGRSLKISKIYKVSRNKFSETSKFLSEIAENQSYEMEYFDENKDSEIKEDVAGSLLKENHISFELESTRTTDNIIKIDNMQTKIHWVNYNNFFRKMGLPTRERYESADYIVSQVKFKNLKKYIYFYSPLTFKNKTQHCIIVLLKKKNLSNHFTLLESKKILGIPVEYIDGEINFIYEDASPQVFQIKQILDTPNFQANLMFNNKCLSLLEVQEVAKNKMITINNSYCIRNCLPFDIQLVLMKTHTVKLIPRGESLFTDELLQSDLLTVSIFFLNYRTAKEVVLHNPKEKGKESPIVQFNMLDDKGLNLVLYATLIKGDTKTIVLHAKGVLINNTLLDVKFYYGKDTKKAVAIAGQKDNANFYLLSDEKFILLECNGFISQPVPISAIGVSSVVTLKHKKEKDKLVEFVMDSNISLLTQNLDLYSNIITLSPRFILYNELTHPILVSLYNNRTETDLIRSLEKKAFYFFDRSSENPISIRLMEMETNISNNTHLTNNSLNTNCPQNNSMPSNQSQKSSPKWNWSEPILLTSDSLLTVSISSKGLEKKHINLEKTLEGSSTFVSISETTYENCGFYIENYSSSVSIKIWQQGYENTASFLDVRSKTIFAWSNYRDKNILCVQFLIGALNSRPLATSMDQVRKYLIDDDYVTLISEKSSENLVYPVYDAIYLKNSLYSGQVIKAKISTDGMRKFLLLTDITHDVSRVTNQRTTLTEMNLRIEKFGISLIGDNKNLEGKKEKYRRYEVIYLYFHEIQFYYKKQDVGEDTKTDMQIKIHDIEIDNQYSYISHFPIIMRPIESVKNNPNNASSLPPFFNCAVFLQKRKNDTTTKIILLNYLVQSFYFTIDSNVVEALLSFFQNLTKEMKTSVTNISPVFLDNNINLQNGVFVKENYFHPMWLQSTLKKDKGKLFIQKLETSPIEIIFSFITQSKDKVFQKILQKNPLLTGILTTLTNVEKVPIILNGSMMNNIYGNLNEVMSNVLYNYSQSALTQIMKMFGGIEILGNPINLMQNLGRGVKDFFQKPIKGIVKGPLEGAKGVLDGSLSLVKHTVEGTFTTTSKITSGISKGILYITQDDDYINDREKKKITEKPKNFVEGIGYGLSSMAGGIFYGVTDIVMKPIQGAKKDKWAGFGKGVLKGLAGVVAKPISGVLELVSKTTEGIKNTVNEDDKIKPERLPRPFYGKFKFIKSFNIYHAQVIEILNNRIEFFRNKIFDFYSCEIYKNTKDDNILIVFTTSTMYIIDISRRELKSALHYSEIQDLKVEDNSKIRIFFKRQINEKMNSSISIGKNYSANVIFDRIKDAIDNNYEENSDF